MSLKVRVRNFQSLEDVSLTIDGLTVVTGTNNAGKSALFRALHGAFTNRPGRSFVRHGSKHCTVDLTFDDGQTLTWKKGQGINEYVINGKEFPNVGHGVPPEVEAFGVRPVLLNDDKYWPQVAQQIQGVNFLLDKTGAVLAEAVADVQRVKQLNKALKLCESDRKKARSSLRVRREDAQELAVKLTQYKGLDEVAASIQDLEERRTKAERVQGVHKEISALGIKHSKAIRAVQELEGVNLVHAPDPSLVKASEKVREALKSSRKIKTKLDRARKAVEGDRGLSEALAGLPEPKEVNVERLRMALKTARKLRDRLEAAKRSSESLKQDLENTRKEHLDAHNEVEVHLGGMGFCPVCGNEVGV